MTRKKILLVDDSTTALALQRVVLSSHDYELSIAMDGVEALEKGLAEKPDLVLLDIGLPRMDGLEVCRRLRADERTRRVRVILVSGRTEPDISEAGFASGCDDYIVKPINSQELLTKVRNQLRD